MNTLSLEGTLSTRTRVAQILDTNRPGDRASQCFDLALISLIILNVVAIVVGSVDEVYQRHQLLLDRFELFSVAVFTIEYLARVWSTVEEKTGEESNLATRLRYMFSPMAVIDLLSILPFYLSFFFAADLRILRIVRLLRVFKLTRYSNAMHTLLSVLAEEAHALGAAFFVMFILMLLAACGIYIIEQDVQPEVFGNIPEAMWWAVATLTTVGYGDAVPITPMGKVFGGIIILIGVGMVALPTGIVASGFANSFRRNRMRFEAELDHALEDGVLDASEQKELQALREQLNLNDDDAELILKIATERINGSQPPCPHCGKTA